MEYALVACAALFAAGLTLYSGFGLGTLLLPVFALFFPVEVAVAATAIVHGANNGFKILLVGRHADRSLVVRFGVPAVLAAFVGAAAMGSLANIGELTRYSIGSHVAVLTPLKLVMAALMMAFAGLELLPRFRGLQFDRRHLVVGGVLSGFFGGFSGHQGALRSAFLAKTGISTAAFVGTNAAIGFLVDLARIATYLALFVLARTGNPVGSDQWPLILTGCLAAFGGVLIGKRFLHAVTMRAIQTFTGILLLVISVTLAAGLV